jgi:hypothetical protein
LHEKSSQAGVLAISFTIFANVALSQVPAPILFGDQFVYTTGIGLSGQGGWTATGADTSTINATVQFTLNDAAFVSLRLFDMLGREVQVVHEGLVGPDEIVNARIDGVSLASGIYVLKIEGPDWLATRVVVRQ